MDYYVALHGNLEIYRAIFGLNPFDTNILIPNSLGIVFSLVNILTYYYLNDVKKNKSLLN